MTTGMGVHSEVGRLRRVVLHRPGLVLERLTPSNVHDLLFEDVLWAERAREEHDAFAALLRTAGVVVDDFATLLAEALDVPGARPFLADRLATAPRFGPALDPPPRRRPQETPAPPPAPRLDRHPVRAGARPAAAARPRGDACHLAGAAADRRPAQAGPPTARDQQPAVGQPRAGGLPALAAAQPPLPARQRRLGVLGLLGQPD